FAPESLFSGGDRFFFYCDRHDRDLHSFPTRRSSDLRRRAPHSRISRARVPPARRGSAHQTVPRTLQAAARTRPQLHAIAALHVTDRKSTRLNSSHLGISYAVFCLKKKKTASKEILTS